MPKPIQLHILEYSKHIAAEPDTCYLFIGEINKKTNEIECKQHLLSEYELTRASKFKFEEDRLMYISSHIALREKLTQLYKLEAHNLHIFIKNFTKPFIPNSNKDFNLSHSHKYFSFIIGLEDYMKVGIDIEYIKPIENINDIIENQCHNEEQLFVNNTKSNSEKLTNFYIVWTRKEALLKMLGVGIINTLSSINTVASNKFSIEEPVDRNIKEVYLNSITTKEYVLSFCISKNVKPAIFNL